MPDFTQLIEQSFIALIKAFLEEHPQGVKEHDFLRHLDEQGVFQALDTEVSSSLRRLLGKVFKKRKTRLCTEGAWAE